MREKGEIGGSNLIYMCPSWVIRHCSACVKPQDVKQSVADAHFGCWETTWLRSVFELSAWNKLPEDEQLRRLYFPPLPYSSSEFYVKHFPPLFA